MVFVLLIFLVFFEGSAVVKDNQGCQTIVECLGQIGSKFATGVFVDRVQETESAKFEPMIGFCKSLSETLPMEIAGAKCDSTKTSHLSINWASVGKYLVLAEWFDSSGKTSWNKENVFQGFAFKILRESRTGIAYSVELVASDLKDKFTYDFKAGYNYRVIMYRQGDALQSEVDFIDFLGIPDPPVDFTPLDNRVVVSTGQLVRFAYSSQFQFEQDWVVNKNTRTLNSDEVAVQGEESLPPYKMYSSKEKLISYCFPKAGEYSVFLALKELNAGFKERHNFVDLIKVWNLSVTDNGKKCAQTTT